MGCSDWVTDTNRHLIIQMSIFFKSTQNILRFHDVMTSLLIHLYEDLVAIPI